MATLTGITTSNTYDAIVVGSGISGGWAAKELTEQGLKVLMLERGRNVEHITGYTNALKEPWNLPHRGKNSKAVHSHHENLGHGFLSEPSADFFVDELDCPYTQVKPFDWYRGYQVGGRSLTWGRQSYRWSDFDYEANAREGVAIDWPIRYADIAPWYDHVESFAGISGSLEGLPQLPDGKFLPPMDLNCVEAEVASRLRKHYNDARRLIIGRVANLTAPHPGRVNCQYRNKCWLGCPFGAYFSTQSATLPAAVKTGNLTLRPYSIVTQILYDKDQKKATGVEILDAEMLEASGVKNVKTKDSGYSFGQGIHEMGTARMGRDPKTSVLNAHNQVWDAMNVFVTDGACMTSASCVNPSLTYMALTARATHYAVGELKKGNL